MVLDLLIQFIYHIVMGIFVSNKLANINQVWMWGKKWIMLLDLLLRNQRSEKHIKSFENKEKTVEYLVNETKLSKEECSTAYDIIIKIED